MGKHSYVRLLKEVYDRSGESALHVPAGSLVKIVSNEDDYNMMAETLDHRYSFTVEWDNMIDVEIRMATSPGEIPPPRIGSVDGNYVLRYGYCSAALKTQLLSVPISLLSLPEDKLKAEFNVIDNQNTLYVFPYEEIVDPNSDKVYGGFCIYFHDHKATFGAGIIEGWCV